MDDILQNFYHDNLEDFNTHYVDTKQSSLRILQWNIRGMNDLSKFDYILQSLDHCVVPIDIIVIGETWVKEANVGLYNITGYNRVFACRQNAGGGLAMFINEKWNFKIVENVSTEGLHHIYLELTRNTLCFDVHGIYRPPSFDFNTFHNMLESWLLSSNKNRSCFIAGDVNVPINQLNNNLVFRYKSLLESHGFVCTNTFATRPVTNNVLDHLVSRVDDAHRVRNDTIFSEISDHLLIITTYKLGGAQEIRKLTKKIIDHRRLNDAYAEFLNNLENVGSAEQRLSSMISSYNILLSRHTRTFTECVRLKKKCPWITYDLWKLIKLKNNYLQRVKRNPNDAHLKELLSHVAKKLHHAKKICKKTYYYNLLSSCNHSKVWKTINAVFGRDKKDQNIRLKLNGAIITDETKVCEVLNNFFTSIGKRLADKITWNTCVNPCSLI